MKSEDYKDFIASKLRKTHQSGFDCDGSRMPKKIFDWQKDIVKWSLRKGRSALFLDTGLGKSVQALSWADAVADHTGMPVLLLTPLAVGPQFVDESVKFGVNGVELWSGDSHARIQIVNYHKLHLIDASVYGGVVADESSILKSYSGSIKDELCRTFAKTRFRLACTATPSPNDVEELGNHAEFLGVCSRAEMLASYFIHDSSDTSKWRLKGHAVEAFWEWVASWAMVMRHPRDIGYDADSRYDLPPLNIHEHIVDSPTQTGRLFTVPASTLTEQREARSLTRNDRVKAMADMVNADDKQWIVWCERNDEGDLLEKTIRGAVQVAGADTDDDKVDRMTGFSSGKYRVLVSKPSLCGFGMNWQHCNRMGFVGISHSFEQFYQAIRRCWRFGQANPVNVHVMTSDREIAILENVKRKQRDHDMMFANMLQYTSKINKKEVTEKVSVIGGVEITQPKIQVPKWMLV